MRAAEIRAAAIGNFKGPRVPGHIHFNTHHENYQTLTSETRWAIFPFDLIEMNEAQVSNWIRRLHDARTNARLLVQEELAVKASSENCGGWSSPFAPWVIEGWKAYSESIGGPEIAARIRANLLAGPEQARRRAESKAKRKK